MALSEQEGPSLQTRRFECDKDRGSRLIKSPKRQLSTDICKAYCEPDSLSSNTLRTCSCPGGDSGLRMRRQCCFSALRHHMQRSGTQSQSGSRQNSRCAHRTPVLRPMQVEDWGLDNIQAAQNTRDLSRYAGFKIDLRPCCFHPATQCLDVPFSLSTESNYLFLPQVQVAAPRSANWLDVVFAIPYLSTKHRKWTASSYGFMRRAETRASMPDCKW